MSEDKAVEPPAAPGPSEPSSRELPAKGATGAGRGVLYIAFAKFYFMFAGMVVQFRLPAILTRSAFGSYTLIASVTSFVNNVLVTGTIQAVSRFSAQHRGDERAVQHAGMRRPACWTRRAFAGYWAENRDTAWIVPVTSTLLTSDAMFETRL